MEVLKVRIGERIEDGNEPPRLALADFRDGIATILRANHDEENIETLIRHIPRVQRENKAASRERLDSTK